MMTFAERFRWNVSLLFTDRIPVSMGSRDGEGAMLELHDGCLQVAAHGRVMRFSGSAQEQAEQAIREFGW